MLGLRVNYEKSVSREITVFFHLKLGMGKDNTRGTSDWILA